MKNEKQFAVITGASSGIGYEMAKVFAREGFDLLVCAEDVGILEAGNAFRGMGVQVEAVQADLATFQGVQKLNDAIHALNRPLDVVVMNAGVGVGGEFLQTDLGRELAMIRLNIDSVVHLSKLVVPRMVARGSGRILITSSIAATMPGPYYAVYAATKSFELSFAEALRFELKDKGITVTALQPGATDTNFFARADMLDTPAGEAQKDDPAVVAEQAFKAVMAADDHVVAGSLMNKVQAVAAKVMTPTQGAAAQGKQTKPHSVK